MYRVWIPYNEFREYLVEGDNGPWGDNYFEETFGSYVEEDCIEIEYKYGDYANGKSLVKWRIPDTKKVYGMRYGGSSCFAMWWCGLTDHLEDEEEEEEQDD
jgi:hypothetical protein